jgi:hypothetical protein
MVVGRRHHAGIADEGAVLLLDREAAEAVLLEGRAVAIELGVAGAPAERPAEVLHHFGIGVEFGESVAIVLAPGTQNQTVGLERDGQRALPNRKR